MPCNLHRCLRLHRNVAVMSKGSAAEAHAVGKFDLHGNIPMRA